MVKSAVLCVLHGPESPEYVRSATSHNPEQAFDSD